MHLFKDVLVTLLTSYGKSYYCALSNSLMTGSDIYMDVLLLKHILHPTHLQDICNGYHYLCLYTATLLVAPSTTTTTSTTLLCLNL